MTLKIILNIYLSEVVWMEYKTAGEVKSKFKYFCNGPDIVGGFFGMKAPREGFQKMMTINRCMWYPDCSCVNYREAVGFMNEVEMKRTKKK